MEDGMAAQESKNEIVVYQSNETLRLEVRVENETVWLTQGQLCELFGVVKSNVSYHLKNIFSSGELNRAATVQEIRTVQREGGRQVVRTVDIFFISSSLPPKEKVFVEGKMLDAQVELTRIVKTAKRRLA